MRMMKKGGSTPCDRRLDRRKVALAAAAALLVCVTNARADLYDFVVDPTMSSITSTETLDLTFFGKGMVTYVTNTKKAGAPVDTPGSLTTAFSGRLYADITGTPALGTLQLLPGSSVNANLYAGGAAVFIPGEDNTGFPRFPAPFPPPNAPLTSADSGGQAPSIASFQVTRNLRYDVVPLGGSPGLPGAGNAIMPVLGGSFDQNPTLDPLGGQAFWAIEGFQDNVGALGNFHTTLQNAGTGSTPFPMPVATDGTANLGSWDGVTLTIPVKSVLDFVISGIVPVHLVNTGFIVAHVAVPEPSTMALLGFGIVGLLSYAWRARKRRPLVS